DVGGNLLFERQARLWNRGHVGKLRIDLDVAYSEEFLKTPGGRRDGLAQQRVAAGSQIIGVGRRLAGREQARRRRCATDRQQRNDLVGFERRIGAVREVQFIQR